MDKLYSNSLSYSFLHFARCKGNNSYTIYNIKTYNFIIKSGKFYCLTIFGNTGHKYLGILEYTCINTGHKYLGVLEYMCINTGHKYLGILEYTCINTGHKYLGVLEYTCILINCDTLIWPTQRNNEYIGSSPRSYFLRG